MSDLQGKNIAILGGTGTVGKALMQCINTNAIPVDRILPYSIDEIKQLEMMEEFPEDLRRSLQYQIGDACDQKELEGIASTRKVML